MNKPTQLSTLLPTLFTDKPLGRRLRESVIWRVWDRAVGAQIASKAHPVSFRDGVLTVAVSSAPWMQQLGFLKRQLIEGVNNAIGEALVTDIYFKAGKVATPPPEAPPPARVLRELTQAEHDQIVREASVLSDDDLRAAFIDFQVAYRKHAS